MIELTDEMLFYAGLIVSAVSALGLIIGICISKVKVAHIEAQMDLEYGKEYLDVQ